MVVCQPRYSPIAAGYLTPSCFLVLPYLTILVVRCALALYLVGLVRHLRLQYERAKMVAQTILYVAVHYAVMGMGINDCMPERSPEQLSPLKNIRKLIADAKQRETESAPRGMEPAGSDKVGIKTLFEELRAKDRAATAAEAAHKAEVKAENPQATPVDPRGIFNVFDDIGEIIDEVVRDIAGFDISDHLDVSKLELASKDVFNTTFGDYLDKHNLGGLKGIFVYGYQVQGYAFCLFFSLVVLTLGTGIDFLHARGH